MSLRARKVARTREAIVAAAVSLFAEQGYEQTSVAQIAGRAEIGPRALPVLRRQAGGALRRHRGRRRAHRGRPGAGPSRRAVLERLGRLAETLPIRERIIASTAALQARALLEYARYAEVVRTGLVERHGLPAERAAVLSAIMLTGARTAYESWSAEPATATLPERLDRVLELAAAELVPFSSPAPRAPQ